MTVFYSARILLKTHQDNQGLVNKIGYILPRYTDGITIKSAKITRAARLYLSLHLYIIQTKGFVNGDSLCFYKSKLWC
jgi:hypothetical protein